MREQIKETLGKNLDGTHKEYEAAITDLLILFDVNNSFSYDDMKRCAEFWNKGAIEKKHFDQYLNDCVTE